MKSFNLVDEKWIRCITGASVQEFSLREVFASAHTIKELTDDSPLVTVALHRFLLAILHRVLGPSSFEQWKEIWKKGKWDEVMLNDYLNKWKHRFDLFDKNRPFYQSAKLPEHKPEEHSIALLAHEAATGNNATLFDHNYAESGASYSAAKTARYIIARQAFAVGGGNSKPFNLCDAPLVKGYTVQVIGANLFQTLCLNLIIYTHERPIPQSDTLEDIPVWEQESLQTPNKNGSYPYGYLDYLTWQSRRLLVIGSASGVTRCMQLQNLKLADDITDPFKCYVKDKSGYSAKRINENKALWRDSHSLFEEAGDKNKTKRPEIFNHIAQIEKARRNKEIEASPAYSLVITGMVTEQAAISLWSREVLPLPLAYLVDKNLTSTLKQAIQLTEEIEDVLTNAIKKLSREILGSNDSADNFAKTLQAKELYWSSLNYPFKKLMTDLPSDQAIDDEEEISFGNKEMPKWADLLVKKARAALQHAINSLKAAARELRASSLAEHEFNIRISRVKKKYPNFFPKGEE